MKHTSLLPSIWRYPGHWIFLLAPLATAGCAATSADVYMATLHLPDEDFTYENLHAGGIAVLGVTSESFDVRGTSATTDWLGSWFVSQLEGTRFDLEVMSPRALADALGEEAFIRVLDSHSASAELDSAALHDLALVSPRPRYVVIAHVESDSVEYFHSLSEEAEEGSSCSVVRAHMRARALLWVRFQVYDLRSRGRVWNTRCRSEKDTRATRNVSRYCESFLESIAELSVESLFGTDDEEVFVEYPQPPRFSEMLCPCFQRFAERLPKAAASR